MRKKIMKQEDGQTIVEYVLLLVFIVGAYVTVMKGLAQFDFAGKLNKKLTGTYASYYKYGNKETKSMPDEQSWQGHPQSPDQFRIFISNGSK